MKNSKVLIAAICVVAGFGLGYLCAQCSFGEGNGTGDITKVSKYSKAVVSPQTSAFQEKIMNDPEAYKQAEASLVVLSTRMNDFDLLVDYAITSGEGIEELAPVIAKIESLSQLSDNAVAAAMTASDAFHDMAEGKKAGAASYETASQNLALAFLMIDRQIGVGKEYVSEVDAYLKGKKAGENLNLSLSRDLWAGYCAGQAIINCDEEELAYWNTKKAIVGPEALADMDVIGLKTEDVISLVGDIDCVLGIYSGPAFGYKLGVKADEAVIGLRADGDVLGSGLKADLEVIGLYTDDVISFNDGGVLGIADVLGIVAVLGNKVPNPHEATPRY